MEGMEAYQEKLANMIGAIVDRAEAVVNISIEKNEYVVWKSNPYWQQILNNEGSLDVLYSLVFAQNKYMDTQGMDEKYNVFSQSGVFEKEEYLGRIIRDVEGESRYYSVYLVKISSKESIMLLQSCGEEERAQNIEVEKINVIQENYLFSMMVNLADDSCMSINTTEISAERQDYMDIKYSDWRYMISNMFMEKDKPVFLRNSSPEYVLHTLEERKTYCIELQMLNMQGEYIWSRLRFTRMRDFSKENPRFVYTVQDIDEDMQRLLNQESIVHAIEEQNEKLKEADQQRTKFFSSMSHEIRTPINAILGMNEIILRETKEENIKSYAADIKSASKFLLGVVNDILDYSKIEAGKMEIVPVEYQVADMLETVCNLVEQRIREKSLEFIMNFDPKLPSVLYGDEIRISQIMVNLLTNALKYTQEGSVTFTVKVKEQSGDRVCLFVSVEDTGMGIREEDLEKLSKEYQRLDARRNRNIEGTGLGMSIVVGLLAQMNSSMQIQSTYGVGSTFAFEIEQKIVDVVPAKKVVKEKEDIKGCEFKNKRIVIADDNKINLKVAKALLEHYGMEVVTVETGAECLERIKALEFDLVLVDHLMPEMDGVETLKAIRECGYKMPVIALTANAGVGIRDEYLSLGFTDYLEKPIAAEALHKLLLQYLDE